MLASRATKTVVIAIVVIGIATAASAGDFSLSAAGTGIRVVDSTGKLVGYATDISELSARIPFVLSAQGAAESDLLLLSYSISTRTRGEVPVTRWHADAQSQIYFENGDCTGSAYVVARNDRVVPRVFAVTMDNRLWVSIHTPLAGTFTVRSAEADGYIGEFFCTKYGNPQSMQNLIPLSLAGDLDEFFVPPLSTVITSRVRAVQHSE